MYIGGKMRSFNKRKLYTAIILIATMPVFIFYQNFTYANQISEIFVPAISSSSQNNVTPQDVLRLGWYEGHQDIGKGEGVKISFMAKLNKPADRPSEEVASIFTRKVSASDSEALSDLIFSTRSVKNPEIPVENLVIKSSGGVEVKNKLSVVGNVRSVISSSSTIDVATNNSAAGPREELGIYAAGHALGEKAAGAGIQLYGDNDTQHGRKFNDNIKGGPLAFLSGGSGRMIISADGKVAMGNALWDKHDTGKYQGLLNIYNPQGFPALYVEQASQSEGTIAVPADSTLTLGHWDEVRKIFNPRIIVRASGEVNIAGDLSVNGAIINEKLNARIKSLESENTALKNRLDKIEKLLSK